MQLVPGMAAIVSGGGSGLGEATAKRLAGRGMRVTILDLDADNGARVAKEIGGYFAQTDVSNADSVVDSLERARKVFGQERVVVTCAGIAPGAKTVSKGMPHDPALFQKAISVNLLGVFNVATQAAAGMVAAETLDADGSRGVIINTASVAAFDGQMGQIAYAASKAGVAGMTLPMARDLSRDGVRVLAIAPGLFLTPMLQGLPQDVQDSLGGQTPFPSRLGKPDEFAALVEHICENTMLNGEVIRLDGAVRMAPR